MYKLIVSDLDGTLVDKDKNISEYTKKLSLYWEKKELNL